MEKLKLSQAVVVEGKYDKIALSAVIDAVIITTEGFGIFTNESVISLIRTYAGTCGIIVLTDSDTAGQRIRGRIKSICPEGTVINIYSPVIRGKERRKSKASKEGILGVEGIDPQELREVFERAGITEDATPRERVTKQDMIDLGLSGTPGSSALRKNLALSLGLPGNLSTAALRDAVSVMLGRERFIAYVNDLSEEHENGQH